MDQGGDGLRILALFLTGNDHRCTNHQRQQKFPQRHVETNSGVG
jgi:hypothetical protein